METITVTQLIRRILSDSDYRRRFVEDRGALLEAAHLSIVDKHAMLELDCEHLVASFSDVDTDAADGMT